MLDGCTEDKLKGKTDKPIVIDQAVDFLQSLFDLLTKLHVHLEVSRLFTQTLIIQWTCRHNRWSTLFIDSPSEISTTLLHPTLLTAAP